MGQNRFAAEQLIAEVHEVHSLLVIALRPYSHDGSRLSCHQTTRYARAPLGACKPSSGHFGIGDPGGTPARKRSPWTSQETQEGSWKPGGDPDQIRPRDANLLCDTRNAGPGARGRGVWVQAGKESLGGIQRPGLMFAWRIRTLDLRVPGGLEVSDWIPSPTHSGSQYSVHRLSLDETAFSACSRNALPHSGLLIARQCKAPSCPNQHLR